MRDQLDSQYDAALRAKSSCSRGRRTLQQRFLRDCQLPVRAGSLRADVLQRYAYRVFSDNQ
jgi:hypothetical protein